MLHLPSLSLSLFLFSFSFTLLFLHSLWIKHRDETMQQNITQAKEVAASVLMHRHIHHHTHTHSHWDTLIHIHSVVWVISVQIFMRQIKLPWWSESGRRSHCWHHRSHGATTIHVSLVDHEEKDPLMERERSKLTELLCLLLARRMTQWLWWIVYYVIIPSLWLPLQILNCRWWLYLPFSYYFLLFFTINRSSNQRKRLKSSQVHLSSIFFLSLFLSIQVIRTFSSFAWHESYFSLSVEVACTTSSNS